MKVYIAIKETLIPYEGTETEILNVFAKYEDAKEVLQKQLNVYLEDYDEIHYSIVEKEVL